MIQNTSWNQIPAEVPDRHDFGSLAMQGSLYPRSGSTAHMSAGNPDDFPSPVRSETESVFFVSASLHMGNTGRSNGSQNNRKLILVREQEQEE
ncbi:hypothetical protein [Qiania dongpingensis]|uniref:Uncharacterized protein n=1 Tax=Qiania dongpingensis TaxID=2763669 RepID=A0A7G9G611_9FIRM|nr:hypothetical protein [Qiania dongpingensis]QNM06243.1 hypothetical protein H9Q78_03570 [Qiania dongpingensis]